MRPPRIIPKDCAESNTLPPGRMVTVCLPALMTIGSTTATGLAAVVLFPVAVGSDGVALAPPGLAAIGAMLWLGAVSTALAMLVFFILVARAGATFVSLANYLVPLLALSLGGVLLGEEPTWNMLAALALILGGVFLTGGRPRKS